MKGTIYGIFIICLLVIVVFSGCTGLESRQSSSGPSRGDNPISGDLTNADISINDPKIFYGMLACGLVSIVGFLFIGRSLARHHAAISPSIGRNSHV